MIDTRKGSAFDADHYSKAYAEGIENDYWSTARAWILEAALPDKGRLLEVGCGRGVIVKHLLSKGRDVWGSELASPSPIMGTKERIFVGAPAETLPPTFRKSIECLLFLDVIEHIDDAPGFLANILAAYPNAATVVVTVPARPEVWSEWDEYYEHRRRYTRESLSTHLTEAGLQPIKIRYFFHSLYVAALLLRLVGRKRKIYRSTPGNVMLHQLIASYLWVESRGLMPIGFLRGLSLLAVAHRRADLRNRGKYLIE
jgi:SAM-dependent methyltransferase